MARKSEVETVGEAQGVVPYDPSQYNLAEDWEKLTSEGDEVLGHDLLASGALISVPFLIHRVTYRDGIEGNDYISCEAVVAPVHVLQQYERRGRFRIADLLVDPGEHVVFNDGSTGIYRQVTKYLYAKGLITLPEPIVENGGKGESSFDLPRRMWESGATQSGEGWEPAVFDIRLHCPRGIRKSDYDWSGREAETYYLG